MHSTLSCLLQLQEQLWQEFLSFAPAALTPMHMPVTAIASSEQLHEDLLPEQLRQKVQLWEQFASWQQRQAHLKPLAFPKLAVKVSVQSCLCRKFVLTLHW